MADAATSGAVAAPGKLDDVMLAMDVVDTLRHQESLVARELDGEARKAELIARLKQIYASQGLDVPDRIVAEGVKALEESRFSYTPTPSSLARTLALLWIDRRRWGLGLAAVVVALAVGIGGWSYFVVGGAERAAEAARIEITETLPTSLDRAVKAARDEAKVAAATTRIDELAAGGRAALARRDATAVKAAIADLDRLTATLRQTWTIRVVERQGVRSGLWRQPANSTARNYYLVVEAIGPDGRALTRDITSEETRTTKAVTLWGQRVPQATYDRIAADKRDDGIIENATLGEKRRGEIDPRWTLPVQAGAITEW